MKYRLIIFDSDGTLADTLPWMRSIFNELAEQHGFKKVEPRDYEEYRDLHGMELMRAMELPLWKLPRVVSAMRSRMAEYPGHLSLFAGMDETLRGLGASGITLAIVSSNSRANVERVLGPETAALFTRFECGVSMFGKAARIRAVVRALDFSPAQTLYVGDEVRDAEASRKAGVAFGAVAWGQHSEKALRAQNPAEFFTHVNELVEKLC